MAGVCHYKRHGGRSRNQKQDDATGACTAYQNFHKRFYNNAAVENGSYDGCNNNTYGNSADLWKPTRILQTQAKKRDFPHTFLNLFRNTL